MTDKRSKLINRRSVIKGLAGSAVATTLAACGETVPPTYGNILRIGDLLTYKAHRLILPEHALAREYELSDISPHPAIGTTNPADPEQGGVHPEYAPEYAAHLKSGFENYGLRVEGLVSRPGIYPLADLKRLSSRARDVQFHAFDGWSDSVDMLDALHPQTILAYGMNRRDLPVPHGAPLRLRVERQIGYKNMKFLRSIVVADTFDDFGLPGDMKNGWAWYVGV